MSEFPRFEMMESKLGNFVHPKIDPNDHTDPTLIGVTRKRRLAGPESQFWVEERGKKIMVEMTKHRDNLAQLETQYVPETFKGDIRSTRFGAGFNRRPAAAISSDLERKLEEQRLNTRKSQSEVMHRQNYFLISRTDPRSPITGLVPQTLKQVSTIPPEPGELKRKEKPVSKTISSSINFCWNDSSAKALQLQQQQSQTEQATLTKRQSRLQDEGISGGKRDWSVAQQMTCGDGFVLPRIDPPQQSRKPKRGHASNVFFC